MSEDDRVIGRSSKVSLSKTQLNTVWLLVILIIIKFSFNIIGNDLNIYMFKRVQAF